MNYKLDTDKLNYMVSAQCGHSFSKSYFVYRDDAMQHIREMIDTMDNNHVVIDDTFSIKLEVLK